MQSKSNFAYLIQGKVKQAIAPFLTLRNQACGSESTIR